MSLLIIGSIGLDTIKTPFGLKKDILGGSGIYASVSAGFFSPTVLLGVAGSDFSKEHLDFLTSKNVDVSYIQIAQGQTFRWEGYYEYDMNQAHTVATHLNVYDHFSALLPKELKESEYVFLANFDPEKQLKIIEQLENPKFIAADTMNFWIDSKRPVLHQLIKKIDYLFMNEAEARQFMETPNLIVAAQRLIELGLKGVIIKKGEHGALLFNQEGYFSAPSFPQGDLRDPTGAGDTFAGAFMGYLAHSNGLSQENIRRAIVIGSVMASFNIEDFSLERMRSLSKKEIVGRFEEVKRMAQFDPLPVGHLV